MAAGEWEVSGAGISWTEARDAARHPTCAGHALYPLTQFSVLECQMVKVDCGKQGSTVKIMLGGTCPLPSNTILCPRMSNGQG